MGDKGRTDLVAVGIFLVCLALALVILSHAGLLQS